jgi:hypothetical protein
MRVCCFQTLSPLGATAGRVLQNRGAGLCPRTRDIPLTDQVPGRRVAKDWKKGPTLPHNYIFRNAIQVNARISFETARSYSMRLIGAVGWNTQLLCSILMYYKCVCKYQVAASLAHRWGTYLSRVTYCCMTDIGANLGDPMFQGSYHGKEYHAPDLPAVLDRAWSAGTLNL